MAQAKSKEQAAFEKPAEVVKPKGKYAEHAATDQRRNVILQSMLELLGADKDFTDAKLVSAHAGFTVTQPEVDQGVGPVGASKSDPNGFYLPEGAKVQDT